MEIDKALGFLKQEVNDLGLTNQVVPTGRGGKVLKKDYVQVLSVYYLTKKYGSLDNVPKSLHFRFTFETPQLAYLYTKLKPVDQEKIWNSPDYWLTEKIDGVRGTQVLLPNKDYHCFSREMDENSYIYYDYKDRVFSPVLGDIKQPIVADVEIKLKNIAIAKFLEENGYEADTEHKAITILLMMKEHDFQTVQEQYPEIFYFKILDLYFYERDLRKLPYEDREKHFDTVVQQVQQAGIDLTRPDICKDVGTKKAFHEGIMKDGGEGTVAVPIKEPCILTGSRTKKGWIKIKHSIFNVEESGNVLGDTLDVYVTDIEYNQRYQLIDKVAVSAVDGNTGQERVMGFIDAIPLSLRGPDEISVGTVLEVDYYRLDDNGIFEDGIVKRTRFDKTPDSCII